MDMHDGNQVAYLCGGLAATCGTLRLTQSTYGFGLTARRSDLGTAGLGLGTAELGIAFGPLILLRREHLSREEQSESVNTNV
jgi:hypothetical protein